MSEREGDASFQATVLVAVLVEHTSASSVTGLVGVLGDAIGAAPGHGVVKELLFDGAGGQWNGLGFKRPVFHELVAGVFESTESFDEEPCGESAVAAVLRECEDVVAVLERGRECQGDGFSGLGVAG